MPKGEQVIHVTNQTSVTSLWSGKASEDTYGEKASGASTGDRLVLQVNGYGIRLGDLQVGSDSGHLKEHTVATPAAIGSCENKWIGGLVRQVEKKGS